MPHSASDRGGASGDLIGGGEGVRGGGRESRGVRGLIEGIRGVGRGSGTSKKRSMCLCDVGLTRC